MKQTTKKNRLILKKDFSEIREHGKKQVGSFAVLLYLSETAGETEPSVRCGVICSRKFDKRAVYRNRARRLLYESFRLVSQELLPCRIIFIPRRQILKVKMQDVAQSLNGLYRKAGLFRISRMSD